MDKHYHFIGIGGIGMGALASLLLDQGYPVSGSDLRSNQVTQNLEKRGAKIFEGHYAQNINDADFVVISSAIDENNPELKEAKIRHIPVLHRAKLLARLMEGHVGITVAGAHGKTTTSSMIAHLLEDANLDPTTAVGGIVRGSRSHGQLGKGKYFVTEVDESDGSFLCFSPNISVITNIDFEHVDYYRDWSSVIEIYKNFISNTVKYGIVIACGDDERLLSLVKEGSVKYRTYGFSPENNICAKNIVFNHLESRFDCIVDGENFGQITLNVPGRHNVANALACISLGLLLKIDFNVIRDSFMKYKGVQRRFQLKGIVDEIWVIDDYAHHPTEIKAVLDTAQIYKNSVLSGEQSLDSNRLITIFQPHRFSRTAGLFDEFAKSLAHSDHLIITDIYAANEEPIGGISAENLCRRVASYTHKPVFYLPRNQIVPYLLTIARPKDVILTLGAGDITQIADSVTQALKGQGALLEKA